MALPQQLPGISVVPQAPQVDPRLFAPDAAGMLLSARAGVQLGTELAGLQNLQGKLELEKAEIAARKAKNEYEYKAALNASEMLPQMVQKELAQAEAARMQAVATQQTLPGQTALTNATNLNALRFNQELYNEGVPTITAQTEATSKRNALSTLRADAAGFSQLDTPGQKKVIAAAESGGTFTGDAEAKKALADTLNALPAEQPKLPAAPFYLAKPGAAPAFEKALGNIPYNPLVKIEHEDRFDPKTGQTMRYSFAVSRYDGRRLPRYDPKEAPIVIKPSDSPDTPKVIALKQTMDMAKSAQKMLEQYASGDRGGYWQTVAANWANAPVNGLVSIGRRAIGTWLQSAETVALNAELSALSNTIIKEISGSGVTGSELSRLTSMLVTTGDLVDPKAATIKMGQTIDYLEKLAKPYEDRQSVQRARLGSLSSNAPTDTRTSSATTPTFKAPDGWTAVTGLNSTRTVNGQEQQMLSKVNPKTGLPVNIWINK